MKKLLFSCVFALSSVFAFAQLDLAVTEILSPTSGSNVSTGQPIRVDFVITNDGSTTLNTGDTIFFQIMYNGNPLTFSNSGGSFNIIYTLLDKDLAPSDTLHTGFGSFQMNFQGFTGPAKLGAKVSGVTYPLVNDADVSNDTLSTPVNVVGSVGIIENLLSANVTNVKSYHSNQTLFVEGYNVASDLNVSIYSLAGQKVSEAIIPAGANTKGSIDTKSLRSGIYIYQILDNNGNVYKSNKFQQ